MVLLDTDILVGLLRNDSDAKKKIIALQHMGLSMSTTSINTLELFEGAYASINKEKNIMLIEELTENLKQINFDFLTSKVAAKIIKDLEKEGRSLDAFDAMIGAAAIANNEMIVTRNIKHFERIKGLHVEKW
ncbi:MAG: type II toxin-antitoxin system VapC family toxin [Candidatus Aenigmatarchaeota archaeon]